MTDMTPFVGSEEWAMAGATDMCGSCPAWALDSVEPCPYWVKGLPCPEDEPLAMHA